MRLRPYIPSMDFETIRSWCTDTRTHAMWCANLIPFPLEQQSFAAALQEIAARTGDTPFVATSTDGKVIGFFCYSADLKTNEGMLKFVMVDPAQRGRGIGQMMLRLALTYAFSITKVSAVQLNVFTENERARRCYERVGFNVRQLYTFAFQFQDEFWGRCNMVIQRSQTL